MNTRQQLFINLREAKAAHETARAACANELSVHKNRMAWIDAGREVDRCWDAIIEFEEESDSGIKLYPHQKQMIEELRGHINAEGK